MNTLSRNDFIKITSSFAGSLVIAASTDGCARHDEVFAPSVWLSVHPDNTVTVFLNKCEMGQGVTTGLPTLVAEELDVSLDRVDVRFVDADKRYIYPKDTGMGTGGSDSLESSWLPLRNAGATARAMLVTAAANQWSVDSTQCRTRDGVVTHPASNRSATYGSLTAAASRLPVPAQVPLKDPEAFVLIGKASTRRLDAPAKVDGSAKFGMDIAVPNMRYAAVERCPVIGGRVKSFDARKAKLVPGVLDVIEIPQGIAVVATNTWSAFQGKKQLVVEWDPGANAHLSTEGMFTESLRIARDPAKSKIAIQRGSAENVQGKTLEAIYRGPFLAHATMEPMNATADVRASSCEIWAPTQGPMRAQAAAARITGLPQEKCVVHTTLLGGGFGRRFIPDFVEDAVAVSKAIRAPVKVVWTREDDIQHDHYRPMTVNAVRGVVSDDGRLTAMSQTIVSESMTRQLNPKRYWKQHGIDFTVTDGAIDDFAYEIPSYTVRYGEYEHGVPIGPWRAPDANWNTFVTESFVDELAHAAGKDPVDFRLAMLEKQPRIANVVRVAAERANWGKPMPDGRYQGLALTLWETIGAVVAQVSMKDGALRVHHVVAVIDCGTVVNPDIVVAQTQSAIYYGLSAALMGKITIKNGVVQEKNFDSYAVLHMAQAPSIDVYAIPSGRKPSGIGEPALPGIAPAVGNALFFATGKRVRTLPFSDSLTIA